MRYGFRIGFALALGLALMAGCSDENGEGGSGGAAGTGGMGGEGGSGGTIEPCDDETCRAIDCDDADPCTRDVCNFDGTCGHLAFCDDFNDCTVEQCDPDGGSGGIGGTGGATCSAPVAVADGTSCAGGMCQSGVCVLDGSVLPCTEQGIRNAIAAGGTYTFACDGATTVVTQAEIAIDNEVTLDGEGKLTVDGNCEHRVFSVDAGVTAELVGLRLLRGGPDNRGRGFDGVISNEGTLTLTKGSVSGDGTEHAIYNSSLGLLTLINSTVSGNRYLGIENYGGALEVVDSTVSGNGGGIENGNDGVATITNSTVSGNGFNGGIINFEATLILINSTVSGNGPTDYHGGIFNVGTAILVGSTISGNATGIVNLGTLRLTNSTVSENVSYGIQNDDGGISGSLELINSTLSGNGLGIHEIRGSDVKFLNSLVSDTCTQADPPTGFWWQTFGGNIESPGNTCGFDTNSGDQVNVTAEQLNLGPLQDNGGPTMTHALGAGSVAIDWVANCWDWDEPGTPLTTDQRGEPRPETGGTMCDVGAFEVQP